MNCSVNSFYWGWNEFLVIEKKNLRMASDMALMEKQNKRHFSDLSEQATSENERVKNILRRRIDQKIDNLSQA